MADRNEAERRGNADRGVAEDAGDQADQEQAQPPGGEHRVDHAAVEEADQRALDQHADRAHDQRGDHQHGDPDVDPLLRREDRGIAAEHQEFAMREVDDPHHAEDDGEPDADQGEARDGEKPLDCKEKDQIHLSRSSSAL